MKWKNIGLKLTTAAVTAAMGLQMAVQPIQAAAASTQYLSEVIISYGNSDQEAKDWLTQNGYKVVNQNLNEGGEGGSDAFSWLGLASERRSVYLGYKTTTDPDEAITDMKIMNMNGGYSYEAYEKVLQELEQEKAHFLEIIMAALKEYRANYKKGAVKAKIAHDNLNKFKDDDSGQLMGDLLLNTLRTEDEAAWQADPTQHADMVTILMQGNSTCVSEIMQNLAFAADTADDSFVNRAIAAANAEESPFDTFFNAYMEQHPGYTKDEAVTELMQLYDDDAKMFASSLVGLKNYLSNYVQSGLTLEATSDEIAAYFTEHEFEDQNTWAGAANLYTLLSNVSYGDLSLAAYLVYSEDDFLTNSALLSGYDTIGLPQRAKLYPLIAQMSAGQRCLLEYTSLDKMLTAGLMDADTWASTYATMQDPSFGVSDYEPCSVFAEVNRDDFKVGEIAVTNAAQGKAASLGEEVNEGLFGVGVSYLTAGIFVGGIVTSIAGIAIAAKNWTMSALSPNVQKGLSLYVPGIQTNAVTSNGAVFSMMPVRVEQVEHFQTLLAEHHKNIKHIADHMFVQNVKNNWSPNVQAINNSISSWSKQLTVAGPYGEVAFNAGSRINYVDGQIYSITDCDGTVYFRDGSVGIDEFVRQQYTETLSQINPDIEAAVYTAQQKLGAKTMTELVNNVEKEMTTLQTGLGQVISNTEGAQDACLSWLQQNNLGLVGPFDLDKQNFEVWAKHFEQLYGKDKFDSAKLMEQYTEYHNLEKMKNDINSSAAITKYVDDMTDPELADKTQNAAEAAMTSGSGSTFWKWFGVGMAIVGLAMSVYSAYAAISEMKAYYHQEMLPIPRKMVDLGYYEDGTHCYIYYDCTKCNRTEMNMGNETLGDYGDLNGDVMKQWLALYTTKDTRAGAPIQAGFTVKKGTTQMPVRTMSLSFFGFDYAVNMTDTKFTYNNNLNGIYLYYKQLASKYTGTVETGNALVTTGVLSALGGAGICGLIIALASKRKKKEPTGEPTAA